MRDMSGWRPVLGILIALTVSGAGQRTLAQERPPANCPYTQQQWMETKLFFGLGKSGGTAVSRRAWDRFVSDNLVVGFPNGFTIIETTGYWRDQTTQSTVYENGKQVVILHEATPGNEAMISAIAEKYRAEFDQQSVLISSHEAKVRFCVEP